MIEIVPLAPTHAAGAARLHIAGQPGTFLSSLGPEVLTVLYGALPALPVGFGFAAIDTTDSDAFCGFVSATTSVARLFLELGTRRINRFLPPLAARLAREPRLILRTVQTVAYPFLASDGHATGSAAGISAELLSIMVEPQLRSQGTGARLLAALVAECCARGVAVLDVTVDAANDGARRFYARQGFEEERGFTLYGRAMRQYRMALGAGEGAA
jgi:ribosomal protein S18 acetylase RimI-like enzyme